MQGDNHNCPQCGAALPRTFRHAKLTVCEFCDSTIYLEDDAVRLAGTQSVLPDAPSLLRLQTPFTYHHSTYLPVGHIRYQYPNGYWDEWWVMDGSGRGVWISVDEGDFAFEHPITLEQTPPRLPLLRLGETVTLDGKDWQVTELDKAKCQGFRGELPEIITQGETFAYAHLSAAGSALMTLEYHNEGITAYRGKWVDPFEIKIDGADAA